MDITIDKIENSEALIKIKLKEADYQPRVTEKIKDFSKKANIKGFRPGKVPPGMIKKLYGKSFLVEEVNKLLSENLNKTLQTNDLQFLGEPLPNEDKMREIDWDNQKDFEFEYHIGYTDDFEVKLDKKVKVEHPKIKIDKKVIDETVENIQKQFGEVTNPETVGENDTVYGSAKSEDGEFDQEISFDVDQMEKVAAKKLTGAKLEDTIEIDPRKSFKDKSYFGRIARMTDEDVKGMKGKISFTIKGINHVTPAEVNQELFDKTFGKDAVKTEEEFREKIKETIKENYSKEEEQFFFYKLRNTLIDKTEIKLPDPFLKKWLLATNENMTEELLENEYDQYANELKWSLIRNKIAKDKEIKVEHEEVMNEAKSMILQQFGGAGMAAQLGEQLDAFAQNYLQGENGENYMKVHNQVQSRKVYEAAREEITEKEKEVTTEEFRKLS